MNNPSETNKSSMESEDASTGKKTFSYPSFAFVHRAEMRMST
jgi:hypothetical protein